jgi:hypothetical protein
MAVAVLRGGGEIGGSSPLSRVKTKNMNEQFTEYRFGNNFMLKLFTGLQKYLLL